MYCVTCGNLLSPATRFCTACGAAATAAPAGAPIATRGDAIEYANYGARAGAFLVDWLIGIGLMLAVMVVAVVIGLAVAAGSASDDAPDTAIWLGFISGWLLALLLASGYRWWGNTTGRSFGKRIVGIRVVTVSTRTAPGAARGLGRTAIELAFSIISPFNLISYLWPLWDAQQRTVHDLVAGTVVVTNEAAARWQSNHLAGFSAPQPDPMAALFDEQPSPAPPAVPPPPPGWSRPDRSQPSAVGDPSPAMLQPGAAPQTDPPEHDAEVNDATPEPSPDRADDPRRPS